MRRAGGHDDDVVGGLAPLIVRAWELRDDLTVDDGVFVALAEATAQPLLTTDLRLARAVRQHVDVEVLTHLDEAPGR